MQKQAWLWIAPLLVAGLAGCLGDDDNDDPGNGMTWQAPVASGMIPVAPDPASFIGTIADSHVVPTIPVPPAGLGVGLLHQLPEMHMGSANLDMVGFSDLSDELTGLGSGYSEIHVVGDLAVVSSLLGNRGLTLLNVSDPANMVVLSHIYNLDDNWDARISPDGKYVFMGCQGSQPFDCTGVDNSGEQPELIGDGVCLPLVTCPGGIAVYDIQDPTDPIFAGYLHMGFTHNVFVFKHDDGAYAGKYYVMNAEGTIAEWDSLANTYQVASTAIKGVHDIAVQKHPLTGDWLLYTGSDHMSIWDVNDPFNPVLLGNVDPSLYDEPIPAAWHEQTPMPCLIDGRHITIGAGESGSGAPQPVGVFDTSDPTEPVYLGQWILPDAAAITQQMNYRFSLHNIDGNCDGQVAVGHYHAGVWVFDISTAERMMEPVTLGYYQPHERPISLAWTPVTGAPIGALVTADVPNVWTAQWSADGETLFIPDMTTGLYALAPQWEFESTDAMEA